MRRIPPCFPFLVLLFVLAARPFGQRTSAINEPGIRLRAYYIGEPLEGLRRLADGQSPNVDVTVASLERSNDDAPFSGGPSESFDRQYVLELSGTLTVERAGEYDWRVGSTAAVRVHVDGERIVDVTGPPTWSTVAVELEAGVHDLTIEQWVNEPNERFMNHEWRLPDAEEFVAVPTKALTAPGFHFRPTQPGKKSFVEEGDRPGLGQKLDRVHPGYRVTNIRPGGMEMPVGGLGMLSDGRLVVARFDARGLRVPHPSTEPNGQLWLLTNPTADDPRDVAAELIADGLYEPSGVCVLEDAIHVSQRSEVSRFDYDERSMRWHKSVVAAGWRTNDFHQISAGLLHEPADGEHPGYLYLARSPGLGMMQNPPNHGSVWRIDLSRHAGYNVTALTGGHRTPNGIGWGPRGGIFVVDNQGEWTPANELNHVVPGAFYGFYHGHRPPHAYRTPFQPEDRDTGVVTEAAVRLPQDEIGNSPTQPLLFPEGHRFRGQLALADMRYGGLNRVYLEVVDGVQQGCAMRFTQGLEAGPNRLFFGPDGSIYVGGTGGEHASTWYWVNERGEPTYQGLERLTPTDVDVFEIESLRATAEGFELHFTHPIPPEFARESANFALTQWTYRATRGYGGPKHDVSRLEVRRSEPLGDARAVRLFVSGRKEGHVVHLRTDPTSVDGDTLWSGDAWYTLNRIPDL